MTDVNTPLLKAYYDALKVLPYPVHEGEEPDNYTEKVYLVISDVTNNDASTKHSANTRSLIQVSIHTWENKNNSSLTANSVAKQVVEIINPTPQSTLTLEGVQCLTTKLENDRTNRISDVSGRKYVSRILIFSHYIYT